MITAKYLSVLIDIRFFDKLILSHPRRSSSQEICEKNHADRHAKFTWAVISRGASLRFLSRKFTRKGNVRGSSERVGRGRPRAVRTDSWESTSNRPSLKRRSTIFRSSKYSGRASRGRVNSTYAKGIPWKVQNLSKDTPHLVARLFIPVARRCDKRMLIRVLSSLEECANCVRRILRSEGCEIRRISWNGRAIHPFYY